MIPENFLRHYGWGAYVVPPFDTFLGQSVVANKRISQLTGFTGSYGWVLLTDRGGFLFVDGRYTLQAKQEVKALEVITYSGSFFSAIIQHMPKEGKVALNPWIMSASEVSRYQQAAGAWTIELDWNQVLDEWLSKDTTKEEVEKVTRAIWAMESDRSFQQKCEAVFEARKEGSDEDGLDHFLLCNAEDVAWLTNFRGSDGTYTPTFQGVALLSRQKNFDFTAIIFMDTPSSFPDLPHLSWLPIGSLAEAVQRKTVAYEEETTPFGFLSFPATWKRFSFARLRQCRSKKTSWEQKNMIQVHVLEGLAMTRFLHWIKTDPSEKTEASATKKLEEFRQQAPSYQYPSFQTISAVGFNTALVHYHPPSQGSYPLQPENLYLVDAGGQYHWGTTDLTRTLWLGNKPSLTYKLLYTTVLQAHIQLASLIFPPQTTGVQLDAIARSFLWQRGLDYPHSTGHGVGFFLRVHEFPPIIGTTDRGGPITEGMIFSNEPGFYEEGWGGIRLENLILAFSNAEQKLFLRTISLVPFEPLLILSEELSGAQRTWLNAYHDEVFITLAPLLEPEVREWLFTQTRPL